MIQGVDMNFDESDKKYAKNVFNAIFVFQAVGAIAVLTFIAMFFMYTFNVLEEGNERMDQHAEKFEKSKNKFMTEFNEKFEKGRDDVINHPARKQ